MFVKQPLASAYPVNPVRYSSVIFPVREAFVSSSNSSSCATPVHRFRGMGSEWIWGGGVDKVLKGMVSNLMFNVHADVSNDPQWGAADAEIKSPIW